ncbi:helix-turn-helix domain-containing protein [Streptomyces xanthophaeus]|uniref:helix-turn-helix domain-containing protein n=1 Tax=Streptomyces xanthophaeus TaxID=67385 RepID=UPI00233E7CCC|nr:helix-turn-helix domain-containing protein [Streptomyces xanthophaeus]
MSVTCTNFHDGPLRRLYADHVDRRGGCTAAPAISQQPFRGFPIARSTEMIDSPGGNMARPERLLDPTAGPLEEFAHALRALRRQAGNPSYRVMAKRAHYSVATLSEAARGLHKPSLKVTLAYVAACDGDTTVWTRHWHRVGKELEARGTPYEPVGRPRAAPEQPVPGAGRTPGKAPSPRTDRTGGDEGTLSGRERAELHRLRREVEQLRQANEVLKAASAIFAADLRPDLRADLRPDLRPEPRPNLRSDRRSNLRTTR